LHRFGRERERGVGGNDGRIHTLVVGRRRGRWLDRQCHIRHHGVKKRIVVNVQLDEDKVRTSRGHVHRRRDAIAAGDFGERVPTSGPLKDRNGRREKSPHVGTTDRQKVEQTAGRGRPRIPNGDLVDGGGRRGGEGRRRGGKRGAIVRRKTETGERGIVGAFGSTLKFQDRVGVRKGRRRWDGHGVRTLVVQRLRFGAAPAEKGGEEKDRGANELHFSRILEP
jgi:hypothetical protein